MLSKTSELALKSLLYLVTSKEEGFVPPNRIAETIGASPTYTAKVTALLVRAGILKAQRGARGGVKLARDVTTVSLLEVIEACQGKVLGDFCEPYQDLSMVCSFHEAMNALHIAITDVLGSWMVSDLAKKTCPHHSIIDQVDCKMKWTVDDRD